MISENNWREPDNNKDIFTVMVENGVLSQDLLPAFEEIVELYDVLLQCTPVNPELIFKAVKEWLGNLQEFTRAVCEK